MDGLTRKTFKTSRSFEYTYYDTAPTKPLAAETPTILLLHGFPDSAQFWKHVIPTLTTTLPHRILVPDLLGYGGTSKPTNPSAFASNLMAADLAELLAHEQIAKAIPTGHDWGSFLAQRLYLFHPSLCAGVALLNVAYAPPSGQPFDLAATNALLERTAGSGGGRSPFAYWELFTAADGAALVGRRLDRFWTALHGDRAHWMRDLWCGRGAMRAFLEEAAGGREDVPLRAYAQPGRGWRERWFGDVEAGGFESPLCWYKAYAGNVSVEAESALPRERLVVGVPVFFLGCSGDDVCLPAAIEPSREAGLLPDLTVKVIDAPHWCAMAEPEEVAKALLEFFEARF
ncbi:Alpha/beta hydrolase fold-1 [Neofusicoccum parvum]|nr:Alpha/beta hydrolase fold-1 [Neofusicoccum parvum]